MTRQMSEIEKDPSGSTGSDWLTVLPHRRVFVNVPSPHTCAFRFCSEIKRGEGKWEDKGTV